MKFLHVAMNTVFGEFSYSSFIYINNSLNVLKTLKSREMKWHAQGQQGLKPSVLWEQ